MLRKPVSPANYGQGRRSGTRQRCLLPEVLLPCSLRVLYEFRTREQSHAAVGKPSTESSEWKGARGATRQLERRKARALREAANGPPLTLTPATGPPPPPHHRPHGKRGGAGGARVARTHRSLARGAAAPPPRAAPPRRWAAGGLAGRAGGGSAASSHDGGCPGGRGGGRGWAGAVGRSLTCALCLSPTLPSSLSPAVARAAASSSLRPAGRL